MSTNALQTAIRRLAFGESLEADAAADAFDVIMRGEATAAQVAALLMALRIKGETAEEVTGARRAQEGDARAGAGLLEPEGRAVEAHGPA